MGWAKREVVAFWGMGSDGLQEGIDDEERWIGWGGVVWYGFPVCIVVNRIDTCVLEGLNEAGVKGICL